MYAIFGQIMLGVTLISDHKLIIISSPKKSFALKYAHKKVHYEIAIMHICYDDVKHIHLDINLFDVNEDFFKRSPPPFIIQRNVYSITTLDISFEPKTSFSDLYTDKEKSNEIVSLE